MGVDCLRLCWPSALGNRARGRALFPVGVTVGLLLALIHHVLSAGSLTLDPALMLSYLLAGMLLSFLREHLSVSRLLARSPSAVRRNGPERRHPQP